LHIPICSCKHIGKNCSFEKKLLMSIFKQPEQIRLNYKIWLSDQAGNGILGDGKWKILKLIEEKRSLKAACDELGYTYRRTWGNLQKIEQMLGFPLLEKHRGGSEKGSTHLTREGKKLVDAFDAFHTATDANIESGFTVLMEKLKQI
jgi:molybdate transport system regulatory protein